MLAMKEVTKNIKANSQQNKHHQFQDKTPNDKQPQRPICIPDPSEYLQSDPKTIGWQNDKVQQSNNNKENVLKNIQPCNEVILLHNLNNNDLRENELKVEDTQFKQIQIIQPKTMELSYFHRHPNSLFKTPHSENHNSMAKQSEIPQVQNQSILKFQKAKFVIQQVEKKLNQILYRLPTKIARGISRTKQIQRQNDFKNRKGKNRQPMAQKLVKKLSGFHYSKNYKQNRNKTLKKIMKNGLPINLQNFTTYIGKLKLLINRKFTRPDMKIKKNSKGQQIDPKKFYQVFHTYFSTPRQRQFIEKFYNQVFKRIYVIMWKSDQRMKRVQEIKVEALNDLTFVEPSCEVKQEPKSLQYEQKEVQASSKPCRKRKAFVHCLDYQGDIELESLFERQYHKWYEDFDWEINNGIKPQKDSFRQLIQKFCRLED